MAQRLLILFFLLFGFSCAMKSGHYVVVQSGDNLKSLSKIYHLTSDQLLEANSYKQPQEGRLYFIPSSQGILYSRNQIDGLISRLSTKGSFKSTGRFLWPVPRMQRISSLYGKRGRKIHHGIDIPSPIGTEVVASDGGEVIYSGNRLRGFGNLIVIAHDNHYYTVYAHNSKLLKKRGQVVRRGELIALSGNTGRSFGPHLHFEIRKRSQSLDPMAYFDLNPRKFASR